MCLFFQTHHANSCSRCCRLRHGLRLFVFPSSVHRRRSLRPMLGMALAAAGLLTHGLTAAQENRWRPWW
jgi:hypothetical protein